MTQINSNLNNSFYTNRNQINFRADMAPYQQFSTEVQPQTAPQVQLPDMYSYDTYSQEPASFKETVKKADAMGLISPWVENPLLTAGTCFGIFKGFDWISNKFGGEYGKSLSGRAANFGDRIATSKFMQSDSTQKVIKPIEKFWGKTKNFANNNSILSAIFNTPARPDWEMPRSEMQSMQARNVQDFKEFASKLGLSGEGQMKLINLGIDKQEKEAAKKFFNIDKLSKTSDENITNFVRLKRLGLDDASIKTIVNDQNASQKVKTEMLKAMNLTEDGLKEILEDTTGKTAKKLETALANSKGKLRASGGYAKIFDKLGFQPIGRIMTGEQYYNRMHALSSAKTGLGRASAKAMQTFHRMATFGGGKLGLLIFMVPSIVSTIKNAQKADKDSKVGTIANGLLTATTWVVTFPLGIKAMFAAAGLKNIGASKDDVNKIREITDNFNKQVKENAFATNADYNAARKLAQEEIKKLKPKGGNLLEKMLRKVGSFLDIGNGNLAGRNILQKLPNFGKNVIGVPMRFALGMFVFVGFFDKLIEKCSTAIFGRHYDEMKEEEHAENKKKQKEFTKQDLQNRMYEAQAAKMAMINNPVVDNNAVVQENKPVVQKPVATPEATITPTPVVQQPAAQPQKIDTYDYIPSQNSMIQGVGTVKRDNYTYIPSLENVLAQPNGFQQNKYIPSQLGANITKSFDNSGLQGALKRADSAEKRAIQVLSGKFAGYQN